MFTYIFFLVIIHITIILYRGGSVVFKEHPKRDAIITWIVAGIGLLIVFLAILPFLNISSTFVKGLLIIIAVAVTAYPIGRHLYKRYKKTSSFEGRHGRKLK